MYHHLEVQVEAVIELGRLVSVVIYRYLLCRSGGGGGLAC